MRKTKIICTLGPSSDSPEMIEKLIKAGMNCARLNFSHGTHAEHLERIRRVRGVNQKLGTQIAIAVDTKGPEIRIGDMGEKGVAFKTGDIVTVTPREVKGSREKFQILCPELFNDVKKGTRILMDDGKLTMVVQEKKEDGDLVCRMSNSHVLTTRKSANVPNVKLTMPFISKKDEEDLRFAARNDADFIFASFVRRPDDVLQIRSILEDEGNTNCEIIAKIENQEGYDNLKEILKVADGVMVARGDLGVEVSFSVVPMYQKHIIATCNYMGKPVITATHMLESMTHNPRPTRAEASDVANAVLDGSDAIMLSGETAAGEYPQEAVKTMANIAAMAEEMIDYHHYINASSYMTRRTKNEAIGIAVAESCLTLSNVSCVMAFTETGGTPKRICRFRPKMPVIAATNSTRTARKMAIYWGVYPELDFDITDADLYDVTAQRIAKRLKLRQDSTMIVVSGWHAGHGNTNTMRFLDVNY